MSTSRPSPEERRRLGRGPLITAAAISSVPPRYPLLQGDTPALRAVYISNLDPTWRILSPHLHLKGAAFNFFEAGPGPRSRIELFFFFLIYFFFALFSSLSAFMSQCERFLIPPRPRPFTTLNKGRKYNNLSAGSSTHFCIVRWKRLCRRPHWCKTKGCGSNFQCNEAAAIWIFFFLYFGGHESLSSATLRGTQREIWPCHLNVYAHVYS